MISRKDRLTVHEIHEIAQPYTVWTEWDPCVSAPFPSTASYRGRYDTVSEFEIELICIFQTKSPSPAFLDQPSLQVAVYGSQYYPCIAADGERRGQLWFLP